MVGVQLLGPVTAVVDGRAVDIGGPRPRAVIAVLALRQGTPCLPDDVIDAVWGPGPPARARETLRVYLSRLRRVLGSGLRREARGYVLHAEVDAIHFRRGLAAATEATDAAQRVRELTAALALWRGQPLSSASPSPYLQEAATELERVRIRAAGLRADALVASGDPGEGAAVLRELVALRPTDEHLVGALMRALYADGRQVEALETYRALRSRLRDLTGLEPDLALQRIHAAVLAQDAGLVHGDEGGRTGDAASDRPADVGDIAPSAAPTVVPPSNIPLPLTSFVGRRGELRTIDEALLQHRIVTVVGAGGAGKTRLATEVARRRRDMDGPWLVELHAVSDPGLVANVVAQTLGVTTAGGRPAAEVLVEALRARELLLVLDNCEHVLDAAARLVARVLAGCPGVRVLATSREHLGVPGESVIALSPLPVDAASGESPAVQLFLERARQFVPGLAADDTQRPVIRRICRELDGLPLAIELAAAESRTFAPEQIADQLADRFSLLAGGAATGARHQRTLRDAVAWSVDALPAEHRWVFAQLSVFRGGFTLDAIQRVLDTGQVPVARVLSDLVRKSLVEVDADRVPRRYRLLGTVSAYAAGLVDESEAQQLRERHAAWCAELVNGCARELRGHGGRVAEARLDEETANVRRALRNSVGQARTARIAGLCAGLWWYWFRRGRVDEALRWLDEIPSDAAATRDVSQARLGAYHLAVFAGHPDVATFERLTLDTARKAGDVRTLGLALCYGGYRAALSGQLPEARRAMQQAEVALADGAPDWVCGEAAFCHGQVARAGGDRSSAQRQLERARRLAADSGHRWLYGVATTAAGELALDVRCAADAGRLFAEAIVWARADRDRATLVPAFRAMAGAAALLGLPFEGARLYGAAEALAGRIGVDLQATGQRDAARTRALLFAAGRRDRLTDAITAGRALDMAGVFGTADAVRHAALQFRSSGTTA